MRQLLWTAGLVARAAFGDDGNATSFGDMLEGIETDILDLAKQSAHAPETFRDHLEAFSAAVNWREPWIRGLLFGHAVLWVLFLTTRSRTNTQIALFLFAAALVAVAEPLNTFCRKRWRSFATQNYFDEAGVFAGVLYCAPLLALLLVMMFNFLFQSANLLVDVKRRELKNHLQAQKAATAKKEN